ncbi:MAG: DNA cytosine methyltransferase [bacterium]|nr:DNA cytosine methyltransferase [bacterium]
MKILSLFSGIGGLELGLEWAGLGVTRWQVEQDAFARQVLARHWPDAERFEDVREVTGADFPGCDGICGGFPCQDISAPGKGAGLNGARSGLWREFGRLCGELRPRLVVAENVAALTVRGLDRVLGDLAALGYDGEWEVLSATHSRAPHERERLFIIGNLADTDGPGLGQHRRREPAPPKHPPPQCGGAGVVAGGRSPIRGRVESTPTSPPGAHHWSAEPPVGRVAHGFSGRVDQLRCLGNAVVPQVAKIVGHRARLILDRGYVSDDAWELGHDSGG